MYTLLVVDDEQYAVDGILEAIDWPSVGVTFTYGVNSVREAKEEMQKHPADVIICDIEMAGENGLDFLKWVKDRGYSAKLIFLTAYARFEYAQESVGLGAAEFLIKPIDHELLKSTVRDVLEQYKEEAAVQKRAEEYEKIKKMWEEQLPEFRSRFWLELLERPGLSVEKDSLQEMLALYRIHLKEGRLSMILIHNEWPNLTDEKEIWIQVYRISDLARKVLLSGEGEAISIDVEHCIILL